jgi:hypothetical protein
MMQWLRKRSLPTRVLAYAAAVMLAFGLAAGVGGMGALMLRGDLNLPGREEPQPLDEQKNAARPQEKDAAEQGNAAAQKDAAEQEGAAPQPEREEAAQKEEAEYIKKVGDIQGNAVEISLDSHNKLLRYDILTDNDLAELKANEAALREFADQVDNLDPPQEYEGQYEVFRSAIDELHVAAQLAYEVVADPTAATKSEFDEYDRHVNEATALLQRSNELVGQDYKTLEGVQRVNPLS